MVGLVRVGLLALGLWLGAGAAQAAESCRLALALALDVSSSVDEAEYDLQRIGLAAALDAPDVRDAILFGAEGHVLLAVYEWSGFGQQTLQLDWTTLRSHADIDLAAAALAGMKRGHDDFPTSIGPALGYGAQLLGQVRHCTRRVIDMSGDGTNNDRYGPREAYRHFAFDGVTVNGLVILGDDPEVEAYYGREVLYGSQAFMVIAQGYDEFRTAMARKLYREVSNVMIGQRTEPVALRGPQGG